MLSFSLKSVSKLFDWKNARKFVTNKQTIRFLRICQMHRYPITGTKIVPESKTILVEFDNDKQFEYPWIFLEDNCTCSSCFHSTSQSRLRKLTELTYENDIVDVKLEHGGENIRCTWKDGHVAQFSEIWLLQRNFSRENISNRLKSPRSNPKYMKADSEIPKVDFQQVMTNDQEMLSLLKTLCSEGVAIIKNASRDVGTLTKIVEKIAYPRITHYGCGFTVKTDPEAVNLAYTSGKLNLHTDLPYYILPPGVQLLHCIHQYHGSGGESLLADGFFIANEMKENFPTHYKFMVETPVEFMDVGTDYTTFFKVHHSPSFVLHPISGDIMRVLYSNQQLSSYQAMSVDQVKLFYESLKIFTDLCYKKENLIKFKLNEGEVLIFDNWRLLHGREAYDSNALRHLEGNYIDWDEILSTLRVLGRSVFS